jgi:hypothetical protein
VNQINKIVQKNINESFYSIVRKSKGKEVNVLGKTRKVMVGITTTALTLGLSGCGSNSAEGAPPNDQNCNDWEWDNDDGVWECDDSRSSYYGHYYYGGRYYKSKSSLLNSKDFTSTKNSSTINNGSKTSSGFGSGSKIFGG